MSFPPIITAAFLFVALIVILLVRQASLEGKLIMVFGALALAAFFRLHFYLLLLVGLALFTFVIVAWVWAIIGSSRLKLVREIQKEAMVDENVPVRYKIINHAVLPFFHTRIWDRINRKRSDGRTEEVPFESPGYIAILSVKPRETREGLLHFKPSVRGHVIFGPVAIEGGDPFGIFTLTKWLAVPDECLVLPLWVIFRGLPSVPARLGAREQDRLVSREGHSHEFLGTRPYVEGDSLRGVHWPLTARHNKLIVRQFQKEVEEEMLVILDADRRADVGEGAENAFEYLVTLTLSLAFAAAGTGRPWSLIIVGEKTETITHGTKEAILTAQHSLARLRADRTEPIEPFIEKIRSEYHHAGCILLTARTDPGPADALAHGDSASGVSSIIIRVDPSGFKTTVDKGIENLKQRRKPPADTGRLVGPEISSITEYRISRGDNIADLFPGQAYA